MKAVKIVALGGSMKPGSASVAMLHCALRGVEAAGAVGELLEIRLLDLPIYTPDLSPTAGVARMVDAVAAADGLLWSSPVYHGGMSGAFKNALDWLELLSDREPKYLTNKPVGLLSTAGGVQGLQAINSMEFVVRALRGWTVPLVIPLDRAWQAMGPDGQIRDEALTAKLVQLGRDVAEAAARLSRPS
jgi:FMN reductase